MVAEIFRADHGRLEGCEASCHRARKNLAPVHPVQLTTAAANEPSDDAGTELSDLLAMDPIDFEELVAALFKAMGMQVMTTSVPVTVVST